MISGFARRRLRLLLLAGVAGGIAFAGPALPEAGADAASEERTALYQQLELFGDVFEGIRAAYVDEVSEEELIRAAINGMLASLDPHSTYLSPADYEALRSRTRGAFGGLGVEVKQEMGYVKVVSAMAGAPAERAGLMAGDLITHVDGEPTTNLSLREASDRLRGAIGTLAKLTVLRDGAAPFEVEVVRESIRVQAVRSLLEDDVLVLRVTTFNEQTFPMLEEAVAERSAEAGGLDAVRGIVLDLRNNPGGLLDQAVKVSDAFLDAGEIVSTRGRDPARGARYQARAGDLAGGKPIVVLINGRSASASEIVAGALQDNRRAIVVGTQSFGKGSVQTIMPMQRRGAMKLTTSRYYTPSGRSIQALGIAPDVIVEQRDAGTVAAAAPGRLDGLEGEERRLAEAAEARRLDSARRRAEDYQLAYAVDMLQGLARLAPPAGPRAEAADDRAPGLQAGLD